MTLVSLIRIRSATHSIYETPLHQGVDYISNLTVRSVSVKADMHNHHTPCDVKL